MDIFNNNYVPDLNLPINPVKTVTRKINMHFDSAFRDNYYKQSATDFMYSLPNTINDVVSIKLTSVDIPNSWHTISFIAKTNCFTIELKGKCFCNTYDIKVPDGNYSAQELLDYLNYEYFYLSNNTDKYLKCIKVSLMENSLRVRFEIIKDDSYKCNDDFKFSLIFVNDKNSNIQNTLGWIMGFRLGRYNDITDIIQSEGLIDTGGNRYIYFSLDDYQKNKCNQQIVNFDKTTINESVLGKIYLYNGRFSLNIMEDDGANVTKKRDYLGPIRLSKFNIKLLDKFGTVIDLNNMDFSFSLELEILYNSNNRF